MAGSIQMLLVLLACFCAVECARARASQNFVARNGPRLMLNGSVFRFSGANIYWLGLDENVDGIQYPSIFRISDALETAKDMGATVVRSHTLGVSTGNPKSFHPSFSDWNPLALQSVDYAIWKAGSLGLKLIIPLTDNYHYYHGGKYNFTNWRGVDENSFYTNDLVIGDFEEYIARLLSHVNPLTSLAYINDSTILAWETGNEIRPPAEWTQRISSFLKSLDPNHLVLDGTYGINQAALSIPSVDMYSDHFYPINSSRLGADAASVVSSGKVFYVGEYNWKEATDSDLDAFLNQLESFDAYSGDSFWSLFPHLDTYGFEQHNDCCTLHYPGDPSYLAPRVSLLRSHAYRMSGRATPPRARPPKPVITLLQDNTMAWRGSVGAYNYSVEVAFSDEGPWKMLCLRCVSDNALPLQRSWIKAPLWFRVTPYNLENLTGIASDPFQLVKRS